MNTYTAVKLEKSGHFIVIKIELGGVNQKVLVCPSDLPNFHDLILNLTKSMHKTGKLPLEVAFFVDVSISYFFFSSAYNNFF